MDLLFIVWVMIMVFLGGMWCGAILSRRCLKNSLKKEFNEKWAVGNMTEAVGILKLNRHLKSL